jgi:hypothetical protein
MIFPHSISSFFFISSNQHTLAFFTFFRFSGGDVMHILFFNSNMIIKVTDFFSNVIEFFVNIFSRLANLVSFSKDRVHHTAGSEVESLLAWIIWIMTPLLSWLIEMCSLSIYGVPFDGSSD